MAADGLPGLNHLAKRLAIRLQPVFFHLLLFLLTPTGAATFLLHLPGLPTDQTERAHSD